MAACLLLTTSCATTSSPSASSPSYVPVQLAGNWTMAGPYNVGRPCVILQSDNYLTFINERGDKSQGVLQNKTEVIALDWEGGLIGTLTKNANRINWANGTWWIRGK
jgi:hypothetical protein